jgi:Protein of unknown function (DUF4058)
MPMHDWTKVNSGLYHHFHQVWMVEISRALNRGKLPKNLSALVEQRTGFKQPDVVAVEVTIPDEPWSSSGGTAVLDRPKTRITRKSEDEYYAESASRIVLRHRLGRIVAFIEIVSPGNKDGRPALDEFVEKIVESLRQGIHVLVIDPFPPTPRDPDGIHKAIWDQIHVEDFDLPPNQNRVLASYEFETRGAYTSHIETIGVGDSLPEMPLFIAPGVHVLVPLEGPYMAAWQDSPEAMQRLVVG